MTTRSTQRGMAWLGGLMVAALMAGCATNPASSYDYTALRAAKPASILILPPLNPTPEVTAPAGVLASATQPLAESGYYVLPVAVTDEMFRQNGIHTAHDAQDLPVDKLRSIFGADAALYLEVQQYGTVYAVVQNDTTVELNARLMDLRTGDKLWSGHAVALDRQGSNAGGGVVGLLLGAVINQIVATATDRSVDVAARANAQLLTAGQPNGLLYGPRSPKYAADGKP